MNDKVRTFRAATTEEAMAQIRREMGQDAFVVDVKQVSSRSLFRWFSSNSTVEVRATIAAGRQRAESARTVSDFSPAAPTNVGTIAAAAAKRSTQKPTRPIKSDENPIESSSVDLKPSATLPVPSRLATTLKRGSAANPISDPVDSVNSPTLTPLVESRPLNRLPESIGLESKPNVEGFAPSFEELSAPRSTYQNLDPGRLAMTSRPARDQAAVATIEQRLEALQQMIVDLGRKTQARGFAEIPPELFPHYLTLIEADVDDEIARELILQLQRHASPGQLDDTAASTALLNVLIEQRISCAASLTPRVGQRQIAMVVGPTGVGKTTTLAKLAGGLSVDRGLKVGLITVDTYRVAAVDQLRTYAEIIDLPMRVVTETSQIQLALDSLADRDLVLIDTAGRSPQDGRKLDELKLLIEAARPDHVYLVLSLASGTKSLRTAAERFACVSPTSLIITKLDEAAGCGGLLAASREIGLPMSYFTTGQEVPRDIEPANPCRAARLILGTDRIINLPNTRSLDETSPPLK